VWPGKPTRDPSPECVHLNSFQNFKSKNCCSEWMVRHQTVGREFDWGKIWLKVFLELRNYQTPHPLLLVFEAWVASVFETWWLFSLPDRYLAATKNFTYQSLEPRAILLSWGPAKGVWVATPSRGLSYITNKPHVSALDALGSWSLKVLVGSYRLRLPGQENACVEIERGVWTVEELQLTEQVSVRRLSSEEHSCQALSCLQSQHCLRAYLLLGLCLSLFGLQREKIQAGPPELVVFIAWMKRCSFPALLPRSGPRLLG
jgi:hypothetical protein